MLMTSLSFMCRCIKFPYIRNVGVLTKTKTSSLAKITLESCAYVTIRSVNNSGLLVRNLFR